MNYQSWWLLKVIFSSVAGCFAIVSAILMFLDTLLEADAENIRAFFHDKWINVKNSKWLKMPENVIQWLIDVKKRYISYEFFVDKSKSISIRQIEIIYKYLLVLLGFVLIKRYTDTAFGAMFSLLGMLLGWVIISAIIKALNSLPITSKNIFQNNDNVSDELSVQLTIISCLLTIVFLTIALFTVDFILQSDIIFALYLTCILVFFAFRLYFFFAITATFIFFLLKENIWGALVYNLLVIILPSIFFSIFITFFSFALGKGAQSDAYIPQTFQMLISNAFFDSLTIIATFVILSWALKRPRFPRIIGAIFFDIFVATICACLSLYLGLINSANSLKISEVINVFFAKTIDGSRIEIGPLFWVMHTTFIPTIFYIAIIIVAAIGKAMLLPVKWFFGVGQEHKNPLKLTSLLVAIFIPIFSLLAFVASSFEDYEKHKLKQMSQQTIVSTYQN